VLHELLEEGAGSISKDAMVQARAKKKNSVAKKCAKRWAEMSHEEQQQRPDVVSALNDLAGGRAIFQLRSQVDQMEVWIRNHFDVIRREDVSARLASEEFGYTSIHLDVKIDREKIRRDPRLKKRVSVADLGTVKDLVAEIQIRTFAEYVIADFGHDRFYKSPFDVPRIWTRQSARITAQLEAVDETLMEIVEGMKVLETHTGTFVPEQNIASEIEQLEAVFKFDPENMALAERIARLHIAAGSWRAAKRFISSIPRKHWNQGVRCTYGNCLCTLNQDGPSSKERQRGRKELERVVRADPEHLEALVLLAETCPDADIDECTSKFEEAHRLAPWDPRVLAGFLLHRLAVSGDLELVDLMRPEIDRAIGVCRERIKVRVNLPHAFFELAQFQLVRKETVDAIESLCSGLVLTDDPSVKKPLFDRITALAARKLQIPGLRWTRDILALSMSEPGKLHSHLAGRSGPSRLVSGTRPPAIQPEKPVVILAGGCDPAEESRIAGYREKLLAAFRDFEGTIISGGTKQGVSGLGGDIIAAAGRKRAVKGACCLPWNLPSDGSADRDRRYGATYRIREDIERHHDTGQFPDPFLPTQPIESWIDLFAHGFKPKDVKLIGIDGGTISRIEFRLAAALGAQVAVIRGSGRAADEIADAYDAPGNEKIMLLPNDGETLHEFVRGQPDCPEELLDHAEKLAAVVDTTYHTAKAENDRKSREERLSGDRELDRIFHESNLQQVYHMRTKLREVNLDLEPVAPDETLTDQEELIEPHIDRLAEIEHGRWNVERLLQGWALGKDDDAKRKRASLVPWAELTQEDMELDRAAVKAIPTMLNSVGFMIVETGSPPPPVEERPHLGVQ